MKLYKNGELIRSGSEPIYSMAQIGQNEKPSFCIWVNPDQGRNGNPYFKMFDAQRYTSAEKSIRIGLLEPKLIFHADGKKIWNVTKSDLKELDRFMSKKSRKYAGYTNWQATIYDWNYEYGYIQPSPEDMYDSDIDAFFDGFYDTKENLSKPSYIPHTQRQIIYSDEIKL